MSDDEVVEIKAEEDTETKPEDDVVVLDFGEEDKEEEDKKGEDKKEDDKKEDKGKEDGPVTADYLKSFIEKTKQELRGELEDKKEKPRDLPQNATYTEEQLIQAENELDDMLDDEKITQREYRQYMRNLNRIRATQEKDVLRAEVRRETARENAESVITVWAEENAPELLNHRTSEYRSGLEFGKGTLGAEQNKDGSWSIPGKIAPIIFGMLNKGKTDTKKSAEKKEADDGYKRGLKESEDRKAELRNKDTKIPKGDKKASGGSVGPDSREKAIMEELGFKDVATYRKIKKGMEKGTLQLNG